MVTRPPTRARRATRRAIGTTTQRASRRRRAGVGVAVASREGHARDGDDRRDGEGDGQQECEDAERHDGGPITAPNIAQPMGLGG